MKAAKYNLKILGLGLILYVILIELEQFSYLHRYISWWNANMVLSAAIFTFLLWKVRLKHLHLRILISLGLICLSFIIGLTYSVVEEQRAFDICWQALAEKQGCVRWANNSCSEIKGDHVLSDGFNWSWEQTRTCEDKILPFPWFRRPPKL